VTDHLYDMDCFGFPAHVPEAPALIESKMTLQNTINVRRWRTTTDVAERTRWCSRCKVTKSLADFPREPKQREGRGYWCCACRSERARQHRLRMKGGNS
jgi:hypothetical protein